MFMYQNKKGHICVTFTDNKPVEAPEYVIAIDETAKKLYMVSGTIEAMPASEDVPEEEKADVVIPKVEELDDVVENDEKYEFAPVTEATNADAPAVEELDEIEENDPPVAEEAAEEELPEHVIEEEPTV